MNEKFDRAIGIIEKYDNHYSRRDKLETLFGSEQALGEALWELDRQGKFDAAYEPYFSALQEAPQGSFSSEDFVSLLERLSTQRNRAHLRGGRREISGWGFYLDQMLRKVAHEPKPLLDKLPTFSEPLRTGAAYAFARAGLLKGDDLPSELLEKAAFATVNGCHYKSDIENLQSIWSPKTLGKALAAAGAHEETELWDTEFLSVAEEHATPQQMVRIAANTYHESEVEACTDLLTRHGDEVEDELRDFAQKNESLLKRHAPIVFGMFLCRRAIERGEKADDLAVSMLGKMLGRADSRYIEALAKELPALPDEKLSELLCQIQGNKAGFRLLAHWYDEKVLQKAIEVVQGWDRGDPWCKKEALKAFATLKEDAAPHLLKALESSCFHRDVLIVGLGATGVKETFPKLIELLADTSKVAKKAALEALKSNCEEAKSFLVEALLSRKKAIRLGVAESLRKATADSEVVAAAKAALTKEKVQEIRSLLEEIAGVEVEEAVSASHPKALRKVIELRKQVAGDKDLQAQVEKILGEGECSLTTDNLPGLLVLLHDKIFGKNMSMVSNLWFQILHQCPEGEVGPWLSASLLSHCSMSWSDKEYGCYANSLSQGQHIYGESFEEPILYHLTKDKEHVAPLEMLKWFANSEYKSALKPCALCLDSDDSQLRKTSTEYLLRADSNVLPFVYPLLQSQKAKTRALAIDVLEHYSDSLDLEELKQALTKERSKKLKARLDNLIFELSQPPIETLEPTAKVHADLDLRLAQQEKSLAKGLDTEKLTPLRWSSGAILSEGARDNILTRMSQLGPKTKDEILEALRLHLQVDTMVPFLLSVEKQYAEDSHERKLGWVLFSSAIFGDNETAERLGNKLDDEARYGSSKSAFYRMEVLRRLATPTAMIWIDRWARKARSKKLKELANKALDDVAKQKGLTADELSERVMVGFGFDIKGKKELIYGSRLLTLALSTGNHVQICDEKGKVIKSMPSPRKDDDKEECKKQKKEVSTLKKEVKRVTASAIDRLENALLSSRRWRVSDFQETYLSNPLLANLARHLLWATYSEKGGIERCFRVDVDLTLADVHDENLTLKEDDLVGLVHPLSISEKLRKLWTDIFFDYELIPPFAQLNREIFTVTDEESDYIELQRFDNIDFPTGMFRGYFERKNWVRGEPQDGGAIQWYTKPIKEANIVVYISFSPGHSVTHYDEWSASQQMSTIRFLQDGEALKLGQVNPVLFSEIVREMNSLQKKAEQAED